MKRMLIVVLLVITCAAYAQQQRPQPGVYAESNDGHRKLSIDRVEACKDCDQGQRFYVRIEGRNGAHTLAMNEHVTGVRQMQFISDKWGLVSASTRGSGVHDIVDMDTGQVVDELASYSNPQRSPSGRYLAFTESYPPWMTFIQDVVRVYDLTLTKEQNRQHDKYGPGVPVPPDVKGRSTSEPEPGAEWRQTTFGWLMNVGTEDILALVDTVGSFNKELKLTVVDLRQGAAQQRVLLRNEVLNNYCKATGLQMNSALFVRTPGTDTVSFTLAPCGKIEVHVPGLQ